MERWRSLQKSLIWVMLAWPAGLFFHPPMEKFMASWLGILLMLAAASSFRIHYRRIASQHDHTENHHDTDSH